ncbi:MAG: hypothetical protein AAB539_03000 [Patescibacteria group bacterium]
MRKESFGLTKTASESTDDSSRLTKSERPDFALREDFSSAIATEEKERLGTFERFGRKTKFAVGGLLLMTSLAMGYRGQSSVEAAERRPGIATEHIENDPLRAGTDRLWKQFEQIVREKRQQGTSEAQLRELDQLFLNMVYNTHVLEAGSGQTPEEFYKRLEPQIAEWVSRYIFQWTGEFSRPTQQEWTERLARSMPWMFDGNSDGTLDRKEIAEFGENLKGNLGLSALDHLTRGGLIEKEITAERETKVKKGVIEAPISPPAAQEWPTYDREVAQRFLQGTIGTYKGAPKFKNPAQREIMEKEGFRVLIYDYARERTGQRTLSNADFMTAARELNDAFHSSFDANGDGTLDRQEVERYEKATEEILGFRMLKKLR